MPRVVFAGGSIFDGTGAPSFEADVAVENGRIVELASDLDGDEVVDVAGRTLLPGLFDCHVHVILSHIDFYLLLQTPLSLRFYEAARNLSLLLETGITTVRDAAGADLGMKRAVEEGLIRGPRMQISIGMICQTGGHNDGWMPSGARAQALFPVYPGVPDSIVDGPDDVRRKVRELVRSGADVIKVATSGGVLSALDNPHDVHFRDDELAALAAEARAAGRWVMAHAQAAEGVKAAVRCGARSIEHGIDLDDEALELMVKHGSYLVPTLVAPEAVVAAAGAGLPVADGMLAKAAEVVERHRESFRRAVDAGIKIAMGTDSGISPHGSNLRELELMTAHGLRPERALHATTGAAAELMGLDNDLGTIEPGKRADLVVVAGDPYDFGSLRERIEAVYMNGKQVSGQAASAVIETAR